MRMDKNYKDQWETMKFQRDSKGIHEKQCNSNKIDEKQYNFKRNQWGAMKFQGNQWKTLKLSKLINWPENWISIISFSGNKSFVKLIFPAPDLLITQIQLAFLLFFRKLCGFASSYLKWLNDFLKLALW